MIKKRRFILIFAALCLSFTAFNARAGETAESSSVKTPIKSLGDGLPNDVNQRNELLTDFWQDIIPIIYAWNINHYGTLTNILNPDNYKNLGVIYVPLQASQDLDEKIDRLIVDGLVTPLPNNPYRQPSSIKRFLFPQNETDFLTAVKGFRELLTIHENILTVCQEILKEAELDGEGKPKNFIWILYSGGNSDPNNQLNQIRSLLLQPSMVSRESAVQRSQEREQILNLIKYNASLGQVPLELSTTLMKRLVQFSQYHQQQIEIIQSFFKKYEAYKNSTIAKNSGGDDQSDQDEIVIKRLFQALAFPQKNEQEAKEAKAFLHRIQAYFLPPRQLEHQLTHTEKVQPLAKNLSDTEVIVIDSLHSSSRHINYRGTESFTKTKPEASSYMPYAHSTATSAIIGAKETLQSHRGVAPGSQVLAVSAEGTPSYKTTISPEILHLIERSRAKVLNISMGAKFPQECAQPFQDKIGELRTANKVAEDGTILGLKTYLNSQNSLCNMLWDFAELLRVYDKVVVISAGNEGTPLRKTDWATGQILENNSLNLRGVQLDSLLRRPVDINVASSTYLREIYDEIPQLKNRIIIVGDMRGDGVTISPTSCLPGVAYKDFIYAPSADIPTLLPTLLKKGVSKTGEPRDLYGELGVFGGTSGAAPRVSGAIALLTSIFATPLETQKLHMTDISHCILTTGTPFWLNSKNRFARFRSSIISDDKTLTAYGKQLYGNGLLNVDAAYQCLQTLVDQRSIRQSSRKISGLALEAPPINRQQKSPTKLELRSQEWQKQDQKNLHRRSQIFNALTNGNIKTVMTYYATHKLTPLMDVANGQLKSPLLIALEANQDPIVEFLATKEEGKRQLVALMKKADTQPILYQQLPDKLLEETLIVTVSKKSPNVSQVLLESLKNALTYHRYNLIPLLIKHGLNINNPINDEGQTALLWGVEEEDSELIHILLAQGADVLAPDKKGIVPFQKVMEKDNSELAKIFLKTISKDKLNSTMLNNNETLLDVAVQKSGEAMVQLLLESGVEARSNAEGVNPLHFAVIKNKPSIAKLLLEEGKVSPDVTVKKNGMTPLHMAVMLNKPDLVKLFLSKGADVNLKNINGDTPLMIAQQKDFKEIVSLLTHPKEGD